MPNTLSEGSWNGPWPEPLHRALTESGEPGGAELLAALDTLLARRGAPVRVTRLKPRVYRLETTGGERRSLVCKRLEPAVAESVRLLTERWLPALGLSGRCPRLLGQAAGTGRSCVWHLYEDLGHLTLASAPGSDAVAAAVRLIAALHTAGADHAVLREVRGRDRDLGTTYYESNVREALRVLEALAPGSLPTGARHARTLLLDRLRALRDDLPGRVRRVCEAGGPETLLHGDLWTTNAFVTPSSEGWTARLIDWDRAGVGPFTYDLSTFLYRFPPGERHGILDRYRVEVERAGWQLPPVQELNAMFDLAEQARYANCVAWTAGAWMRHDAEWAPAQLVEIHRWFLGLRPALPEHR